MRRYECYVNPVWHFIYVSRGNGYTDIIWSNSNWFANKTWFPVGWQR